MKRTCIECNLSEPEVSFRSNSSSKKQSSCNKCTKLKQLYSRQAKWEAECKKFGISTMRFITGRNKR